MQSYFALTDDATPLDTTPDGRQCNHPRVNSVQAGMCCPQRRQLRPRSVPGRLDRGSIDHPNKANPPVSIPIGRTQDSHRATGTMWPHRLRTPASGARLSFLTAGADTASSTDNNEFHNTPIAGRCTPLRHHGVQTMIDRASSTSVASRTSAAPDPTDRQNRRQVGSALRYARIHRQLSLREVERRIGRSNAYLSQVERGLIKQPDPTVLLDLAKLYGLDFESLATWAHWLPADPKPAGNRRRDSTAILVRQVMELDAKERATVLRYIESILRERKT